MALSGSDLGILLGLDVGGVQSGAKEAVGALGSIRGAADVVGASLKVAAIGLAAGIGAVTAGAGALVGAAKKGLDELSSWNEQVNTLHDNLGVTGAQASAWAVAFNHVGLSVEEGGAGLNYFTKQLDDLKNVGGDAALVTTKNADAIAGLNQRLEDANTRLQRAKEKLAEAKTPTKEMQYAVTDAEKAVARLNTELGTATKLVPGATATLTPFQKALKELGITAFDSKGKLLKFDDLMPKLLDAFAKMPAGVKKSALAMDLFGARAGTKFLDFLSQGSEGLEKARQMAKLYGLELDTDLSNAVEDFGFAMNDVNLAVKGFWVQIGKNVLPVATRFLTFFNTKLLPVFLGFAKKVAPLVGDVLGKVEIVFEDFINLISGDGAKLAPFAKSVGDLAALFGLSGTAVQDFILGTFRGFQDLMNNPWVTGFLPWLRALLGLLQKGDWYGFFESISETVKNFWVTVLQPALTTWGKHFWDWAQDAAGQLGGRLNELRDGIVKWIQDNGPAIVEQFKTWGKEIWGWITEVALPALAVQGQKLVAGIVKFVQDNGPKAWGLVTEWGGKFWDWLSPILQNVGLRLQEIATSIASWLDTIWHSTIAPALAQWATDFWKWLVGSGGVVDQVSAQMLNLSNQFLEWSRNANTVQSIRDTGKNIAIAIIDAVGGLFDGAEGQVKADSVLSRLVKAFMQSVKNMHDGLAGIGAAIGESLIEGIFTAFTGKDFSPQLQEAIRRALDLYLGGHPNLLSPLVPPSTTPFITPPVRPGERAAFTQGGNMSFQVMIDGQEIKNAVLKVVYSDVENTFQAATQTS